MSATLLLAAALALMLVWMTAAWAAHFPMKNAGIVDAFWAGGLGLVALLYLALADGWLPRRLLVAGLASVWSFRLAWYLWRTRVWRQPEEGRYVQLRAQWAPNVGRAFFVFFHAQGLLVVILSLVYLLPMRHAEPGFAALELAGAALFFVALSMEALADAQLHRFKSDPANKGKVCRDGLWRWSRHPNYFFEWLIWVALFLVALAAPWGWLAIVSPALILYAILFITGIPPTEAQALRSRGDSYRDYQRTTSAFLPWFPKKA